jgi:Flp pilus assembly protein TadB
MDMVFTFMLTDQNMRENGKTINNMVSVANTGLTAANTKASTSTQRKKARDSMCGLMVTDILVSGTTTPSMATVFTSGPMAEFMSVSGKTT